MEQLNTNQISYCGFYCTACPMLKKGKCTGCKGEQPKCAVGYKACKVRPCCIENNYSTCAECTKYNSVKDCKKYNPLLIRIGQFLTLTRRSKGIEIIKSKGETEFIKYMKEKDWVTVKLGKEKVK